MTIWLLTAAGFGGEYRDFVHVGYQVYKDGDPYTGSNPAWDSYSYGDVLSDMRLISRHFNTIRTWTIQYSNEHVIPSAFACGVEVVMGSWAFTTDVSPYFDETRSKAEIDAIVAQAKQYPGTVTTVICGNENLVDSPSPDGIIQSNIEMLMSYARTRLDSEGLSGVKVTTCQTSGVWAGHGSLAAYTDLDVVYANIYPFWNDNNPDDQAMIDYFEGQYASVAAIAGGKDVIIGETGWATDGGTTWPGGQCKPGVANAKSYFDTISQWFSATEVEGYIFEMFDEPWKYTANLPQESHFGIFEGWNNNIQKFAIPVINVPPVIQSGDYNGDGTADIGLFRGSAGLWAVRGVTRRYFGSSGDTPVCGDYDGDGTSDIGIFRPSSGLWAVHGVTRAYFGSSSDTPVPGDYDGDGRCDPGIFRGSAGLWAIRGVTRAYFGTGGDIPAPGDYNGDGTSGIGLFRGSAGLWALRGVSRAYFGSSIDAPVPGDYNGDGTGEAGIFRPSAGLWAVRGVTRLYFGSGADQPVPADYSGDLAADTGIFRDTAGLWAIRNVSRAYFGSAGDIPLTR